MRTKMARTMLNTRLTKHIRQINILTISIPQKYSGFFCLAYYNDRLTLFHSIYSFIWLLHSSHSIYRWLSWTPYSYCSFIFFLRTSMAQCFRHSSCRYLTVPEQLQGMIKGSDYSRQMRHYMWDWELCPSGSIVLIFSGQTLTDDIFYTMFLLLIVISIWE